MKFDIECIFRNTVEKIQDPFKSDKNKKAFYMKTSKRLQYLAQFFLE